MLLENVYSILKANPKISVIIIAHLRRNFIKIAVESVIKQSLPRDYYEIIVVKNFIDKGIDNFIESHGVINIYTDAQALGDKCIKGIENSNGEIIVFLEDDDIFEFTKLEKVTEAFEVKHLVYFHNSHHLIDLNGRIIKASLFSELKNRITLKRDNADCKEVGRLLKQGSSFNLSSIAIKSDILLNHLSYLKGMNVAVDNFMFYVALATESYLRMDPLKLTFYRVHGENSSFPADDDTALLLSRAKIFLESDIYGYNAIHSTIMDPFIDQLIKCRMMAPRFNMHIIDRKKETITVHDYKEAIKCAIKMRNIEIFILLLVDLFTRKNEFLGRTLYAAYLQRRSSLLAKKLISKEYHSINQTD